MAAGDISRGEALEELSKDPYHGGDFESDLHFVLKKFKFSRAEFDRYMKEPPHSHREYPTNAWFFEGMPRIRRLAKRLATRI